MKLSIIIPVYNVEKYIEKTLRSILSQCYDKKDVEIIVVIDGSPDNSQSIVQRIIDEGNTIKMLVQKNQGLSMARNNGMNICSGEYIWFIDSDDWLPNGSISTILEQIDGEIDELDFDALEVSNDEKTVIAKKSYTEGLSDLCMSGLDIWMKGKPHIATAQLSVYRREFLRKNNLLFIKGIYHEDFEFCPRASLLSKKTKVINKPLYMQRVNPHSITHTVNPQKSYDYITVAQSLNLFINKQQVPDVVKRKFYYYISMAVNNSFDNMKLCSKQEILEFNLFFKSKSLLLTFFKSCHLTYIIEGICLCLCGNNFVQTYAKLK